MDPRRAEQIKQAREMEFREVHGCSRESHSTRIPVRSAYPTPVMRPEMSRSSSVSSSDSDKSVFPSLIKSGEDIWR